MGDRKIYIFIGTTAEFIKMAPILKELKIRKISFKLITSGQTKVYFEDFSTYLGNIEPYYRFKDKINKSSIVYFIVWAVKIFFHLLLFLKQDLVNKKRHNVYFIVHGDTVSSLLGAIAGSLFGLQVVHIESGLRSFNFFEPFPEEICRFIISKISNIHFCPNNWALKNLKKIKGVKINTKQNTFIENFLWAVKLRPRFHIKVKGKYFVLVVHRQEHVVFGKQKTREILNYIFENIPRNISCVFIIHELTKHLLNTELEISKLKRQRVILTPRTSFINFVNLLKKSEFIITDGGTNQEEAYYLGKPCLLLRNATERIEGLGKNVLLSNNDKLNICHFIRNYENYRGDNVSFKVKPSKIIVDYLMGRST